MSINHPRNLLVMWRGEADRLKELCDAHGMEAGAPVLRARMYALLQCAQELENRLLWSGMEK
jgi:hypothetical protein